MFLILVLHPEKKKDWSSSYSFTEMTPEMLVYIET